MEAYLLWVQDSAVKLVLESMKNVGSDIIHLAQRRNLGEGGD